MLETLIVGLLETRDLLVELACQLGLGACTGFASRFLADLLGALLRFCHQRGPGLFCFLTGTGELLGQPVLALALDPVELVAEHSRRFGFGCLSCFAHRGITELNRSSFGFFEVRGPRLFGLGLDPLDLGFYPFLSFGSRPDELGLECLGRRRLGRGGGVGGGLLPA